MLDTLQQLDTSLFLFLNDLHAASLDDFMLSISGRFFWIPFYFLLVVKLYKKYEVRSVIYIVIFAVLLIVASDQGSVHLFKNVFQRLRPCHNETLQQSIHLLKSCGGQYGFISSHAANTFALAVFVGVLLNNSWLVGLLIWALVVSYSRIYLGVHYPGDILVGGLYGSLLGFLFNKGLKRLNLSLKSNV